MSASLRSVVGTLLVLVIAFCSVFIVTRLFKGRAQIDTTADQLYSLTDGTKAIVDRVNEPLKLQLYYSKTGVEKTGEDQLLQFNDYYVYVRDLLRSYARRSPYITFEEYDPRPFTESEEEADRLKLQRFALSRDEGFYFGLAAISGSGDEQVIQFLAKEEQELIEYRISELLDRIQRREKTKLGVLSSLNVNGGGESDVERQMMMMQGRQPEPKWLVIQQLGTQYDVVPIEETAEEIPLDLGYLLVVHPKELSEKTLYAIDQFVMRGGKLAVFCDPWCLQDQPAPDPNNPMSSAGASRASNLNRLLSKYGVEMTDKTFAGDLELGQVMPDPRSQTEILFPGIVKLVETADGVLNQASPITKGLEAVEMILVGTLRETNVEGVEVTPLIQTSSRGGIWTAENFEFGNQFMPADLVALSQKFSARETPPVMAAMLTGTIPSAFDGPPGTGEDVVSDGDEVTSQPTEPSDDGDHLAQSSEANTIVVFTDVDMITNGGAFSQRFGFAVPRNSNLPLVQNALETLAGSTDLLSVRSRGRFQRPFETIQKIERDAEIALRDRVKEINDEIKQFESELRSLDNELTADNVGLIENEAINKQREVGAKLRTKKRELRQLQADSRARIAGIKTNIKVLNIFVLPGLVLLVGIAVAVVRTQSRRQYVKGGAA